MRIVHEARKEIGLGSMARGVIFKQVYCSTHTVQRKNNAIIFRKVTTLPTDLLLRKLDSQWWIHNSKDTTSHPTGRIISDCRPDESDHPNRVHGQHNGSSTQKNILKISSVNLK